MADKKISELTELTTPDGTEELVVNDSGTSKKITQTNLLSTALPLAGGTMTGDVSLGDNVKAKFGASDDLQIYHNPATGSYIEDAGAGNLILKGTSVVIDDSSGARMAAFIDGGAVTLNHGSDASARLATTATGIDVTGGIVASGDLQLGSDSAASNINALGDVFVINVDSNSNTGGVPNIQFKASGSEKMRIDTTGIDVTGSVTADGLTVNDTGGASISYGYSLINSSARNGSGSIQLSSIPSIAMLLDYHDANQTVATVRNTYGATSALAELALDSGFITFNTGTSFTERMRIDSEGAVTMPSQPAFSAYINAAQNNLGVALYVDLQFNAETFDQGNDFNTGTYEFTAPVTGKYQLQVYTRMSGIDTAANYTRINIATSNRNYTTIDDPNYTSDLDYHTQRIMVLADMDAGDTAKVQFYQSGGSAVADAINGANSNNFSGYLVA